MRRLSTAGLLILLASFPAAAADPLAEALDDPAKVAELLKEVKPKTEHLEKALHVWRGPSRIESAKLLLRAGVKAPVKELGQHDAVVRAASLGDAELLRLLLAAGARVDARSSKGGSTTLQEMSYCISGDRPEVVSLLLDAGAEIVSARGPAAKCCLKTTEVLLARGAKLDFEYLTPDLCQGAVRLILSSGRRWSEYELGRFVVEGDTETARVVLESSGTPRLGSRDGGRGLRRALFELGRPDLELAGLIARSAEPGAFSYCEEDKPGLLQQAALRPDARVVAFLLDNGMKPAAACAYEGGAPPLNLAVREGSPESIKALMKAGARPGMLLHEAVRDLIWWRRGSVENIKALIEGGAPVDARDPSYGNALDAALSHYVHERKDPSLELVDVLLAAKPRLDIGLHGPLLLALRWPAVARRLIKAGADINALDAEGQTLLFYVAIIHEDAAPARMALALELGADPNRVNKTGQTPLMRAAMGDEPELVSILLKHGADPQKVEAGGRTALDLALLRNKLENAQLLRGVTKTAAAALPAARAPAAPAPAPDVKRLIAQVVAEARAKARPAPAPAAPAAPAPLVSDVDKPGYALPEDPDSYAVVVGVEEYSELPKAAFAERDAAAARRHFKALGVPERNLILLSGPKAVRSAMAKYLESWLPKNADERSKVYFYFSGHGAPDPATGKSFLMPWDGDASFLADTAYPVERLYKTLDGLKAKQVVVALDACFSGAGGRSVLPEGARPLVSKVQKADSGRLTVLSAAQSDQITGVIKEQGHGIFTYYLLKGLSGAGAGAGGTVTPESLFSYLKPKVEDEARRQNRGQSPSLSGPSGVTLRR